MIFPKPLRRFLSLAHPEESAWWHLEGGLGWRHRNRCRSPDGWPSSAWCMALMLWVQELASGGRVSEQSFADGSAAFSAYLRSPAGRLRSRLLQLRLEFLELGLVVLPLVRSGPGGGPQLRPGAVSYFMAKKSCPRDGFSTPKSPPGCRSRPRTGLQETLRSHEELLRSPRGPQKQEVQ